MQWQARREVAEMCSLFAPCSLTEPRTNTILFLFVAMSLLKNVVRAEYDLSCWAGSISAFEVLLLAAHFR